MLRLNSDPHLMLFDPEIERTLWHAAQVRRRAELENTLRSQATRLASDNDSVFSFDSDFESRTSSSNTGTFTMGDVPRLMLKQLGGASIALENQPTRYSELNANFELKSGLINLLPKFHGLPGKILSKGKAKDWYHTLPNEVIADWTLFRKKTRATNKGVYEVARSESSVLAKSLVDIASMLKEIKEGQQSSLTLLKRHPDTSQQKPAKQCGICSCNSHHTDECLQLQEDNMIASTHNFFEATTISPYNKQYYTQGWRDNQPTRWNPLSSSKLNLVNLTPTANRRTLKIQDTNLHITVNHVL
ncbi:hypothetical protein PIB30_067699 [Stylosanthes scabra]|uniref:Uncharacterized protein n=1 Tax=Stylosanthes scabra TaxID=79078 RepID=A0ABU6YLK2_9FABA|nr:hypothetical protein [Stylosanthes scabra]